MIQKYKYLIFLSLVILLMGLVIGCGYSQEELDRAKEENYTNGYNDGLIELGTATKLAHDDGYQEGHNVGLTEGYVKGLEGCSHPHVGPYIGSINSDIYHYPWCPYARNILPKNAIWFDSVWDAERQGYRPCKVCKPP